jgi:hypothetical protein
MRKNVEEQKLLQRSSSHQMTDLTHDHERSIENRTTFEMVIFEMVH